VNSTDKFLNVFYSYDKGSYKDLDHLKQLENNLTRSLIICFDNMDNDNKKAFLIELFKRGNYRNTKLNFKDLRVDLQSINDKKLIHHNKNKILIALGSKLCEESKESLSVIEDNLTEVFNGISEKSEKALRKYINSTHKDLLEKVEIKDIFKEKQNIISKIKEHIDILPEQVNNIFGKLKDKSQLEEKLDFFYSLLGNAIPDAWIYNNSFCLLIEAKVGGNRINKVQLYRHLTQDGGFKLDKNLKKGIGKFEFIDLTWSDIYDSLDKLDIREKKTKEYFLINQLKEYLKMNGEKFDLKYIVEEGKGYDRDKAKVLFPKFLEELDKKIDSSKKIKIINFKRANRPKSGTIWDFYGIEKKDDPHYSIYFDEDGAGIELTTKGTKLIENILNNVKLKDYLVKLLNKYKKNDLTRYSISLGTYRLIDHKKGQMKGETFPTFSFKINLSEIYNRNNEIDDILSDMKKYSKISKQIGIKFSVTYPDISKIQNNSEDDTIRLMNKKLFEDYNKLFDKFVEFIVDTQEIFKDAYENKVKKKK